MDYLALSYYYSQMVDSKRNDLDPASITPNPHLKANPWGWAVDPKGYIMLCHNTGIDTINQLLLLKMVSACMTNWKMAKSTMITESIIYPPI